MFYRFFFIVFLFQFALLAQTPEQLFEKGNEQYRNKEYDAAIESYNALLDRGYESAELYYNMGNAFYRLDNTGYAILFYEKALKLEPSNEDMIHNRKIAEQNTTDKVEEIPQFFLWTWWDTMVNMFSINGWLIITYLAYLFLLFIFSLIVLSPSYQIRKLSLVAVFPMVFFLLVSAGLLYARIDRDINQNSGIIITQSANGKTSPDFNSIDAFVIHEGLKVKVEDSFEDWYKIRLADGKVGWVLKEDLALI